MDWTTKYSDMERPPLQQQAVFFIVSVCTDRCNPTYSKDGVNENNYVVSLLGFKYVSVFYWSID